MTPQPSIKLLSVKKAACLLDLSVATVWKLIKTRKLPVVKVNNKTLLSENHLRRFVRKHTIPATSNRPQEIVIVLE
jgi:excisionase family DNA binding protein